MDKIVIFKFGALGDIIIATPIIKTIVNYHGNVTLITQSQFLPVFENWQGLKVEVINNKSIIQNIKFLFKLKRNNYSQLYDLQSNDRSRILCMLSGIPKRVGNHRIPYTHYPKDRWTGQVHIFSRMCEVLKSAGLTNGDDTPHIPCSKKQKKKVIEWLSKNGVNSKKCILLHAGSSKSRIDKRWPFFKELASILDKKGFEIIWIGDKDDAITNANLSKRNGINATCCFSIAELTELGRLSNFAITNDSAPMHVLSASNIPVFGLFGPSNPNRNHALGQKSRIITAKNNSNNMADISVNQVISSIEKDGLIN